MSQVAPNFKFSGALPWTPLGELTALPRSPSWLEGASLPLPKNLTPALGPWASFFFIFKHSLGSKKVLENFSWGSWKVLDYLSVKEWELCTIVYERVESDSPRLSMNICDCDQLSAAYNQITDMSAITLLSNITVLNLSNNSIASIKCMY